MAEPNLSLMKLPRFNAVDYAWGLALQDYALQPLDNDRMQFALVFHNCADGPIKMYMEDMDLKFEGCLMEKNKEAVKPTIIARGLRMQYMTPVIKRLSVNQIPRITGKLTLTMVYGHPDFGYERRCTMQCTIAIAMTRQGIGISANTDQHDEEPYKKEVIQ